MHWGACPGSRSTAIGWLPFCHCSDSVTGSQVAGRKARQARLESASQFYKGTFQRRHRLCVVRGFEGCSSIEVARAIAQHPAWASVIWPRRLGLQAEWRSGCCDLIFWSPNRATLPSAHFLPANFQHVKSALRPLPSAPRIFSGTPPFPPKFAANFSSCSLCSFHSTALRLTALPESTAYSTIAIPNSAPSSRYPKPPTLISPPLSH